MKTVLTLIAIILALSARADEGVYIYITNKAGVVKKVQVPPLPPVVTPVNRNPLNRATFPPESKPEPPHVTSFTIATKDPIALLFTRGRAIDRQDVLIAKYPNEERFKRDRAELIKQIDAALAEGVASLTNDAKRQSKYRAAVRFWNSNHVADGMIVQAPPPTNKVYFTPELKE